jgi:hypothetical protein
MNKECEKCFYYSGDRTLLPCCFHLNSAIMPGWEKCYEDKECPQFADKEKKYKEIKEFFNNFIQNDVNVKPNIEENIQTNNNEYIILHGEPKLAYTTESIIGKINFNDGYYGKLFLDAIKKGEKLILKPYGINEYDDNGNVKNFNLIGFNICTEK